MIVWGGSVSTNAGITIYADGALYDPAGDTWSPMNVVPGVNSAPYAVAAVWTGTELLVWGIFVPPGTLPSEPPTSAPVMVAYDPSTNAWTSLADNDAPSWRGGFATVWTGTEMLIWGGTSGADNMPLNDGAAYNPATQTWRTISPAPATGLDATAAVWSGTEMLVWGGYAEYPCGADCVGSNYGYRYNPTNDQWQYITTVGAPGPREGNGMVWTGQSLVVWGGVGTMGLGLADGAIWTP
jgi:N-acetylneuraminic acid mutarotase